LQKNLISRGDAATSREQYVAIVDAGGATLGVIELVGHCARENLLGSCGYSAQELAAVSELGKHVGAFLDIDAQATQVGSK
jgi:hypothetical protein